MNLRLSVQVPAEVTSVTVGSQSALNLVYQLVSIVPTFSS